MSLSRNPKRLLLALAIAALTGLILAGCGTSTSEPDTGGAQDRGRQLFTQKCGTCHALAQAATAGTRGPDLDDAFAAARATGQDDATIAGIVKAQVESPRPMEKGFPSISMPADIVTGNDLDDVAAYVGKYAGVPGAKPPPAPGNGPGAQVFANNGCGSCHTLAAAQAGGTYGPDLDEVIPTLSKDKIIESIVAPEATKAKGYENAVMPDRFSTMPKDQLNQLVKFLMTSAGSGKKSSSGS